MVRELPPVANNDSVRLYHGVETKLDLFDNDYDYYGGLVFTSIEITRAPSGGSLSVDTLTGAIVYKPDVCTFGVDSFEYVVYNEKGTQSNPAMVYIAVDIHPTLDSDGDGIADILEDVDGTGNLCDTDTDGNKVPNFLDPDDDGDGIPTALQHGDLNKNGVPDYLENWNSKAVDDETLTGLEIPVVIPVLRNDSTTMVPATLHIINYSKHGFTNIDWSTNTIVYNPDLGFTGLDSILYVVCDHYNICDSATVYITVEDIIVAPELFTPNGDGFNDVFIIRGLDRYPQNQFVVYNRWGNKVYEKANYANDWDGTANVRGALGNRQLPTGVYFFILKYGSNKEIQRGFFLER
jgi:gliding motility-associated-like protein